LRGLILKDKKSGHAAFFVSSPTSIDQTLLTRCDHPVSTMEIYRKIHWRINTLGRLDQCLRSEVKGKSSLEEEGATSLPIKEV
jgi:hypothetical protein